MPLIQTPPALVSRGYEEPRELPALFASARFFFLLLIHAKEALKVLYKGQSTAVRRQREDSLTQGAPAV